MTSTLIPAPLVILTGASCVGKTTIALTVETTHPELTVFRADTIGVPSAEVMATYGPGHQPGGAWQRYMTLQWIARIAPLITAGEPILFEGQMRIAFIHEALALHNITHARILLIECDDQTRKSRLTHDRQQPELASESMNGWSRYLHSEAIDAGHEIIDTGITTLPQAVKHIVSYLARP